ncbi:glycosyltransferase family 2 protein [Microbispora sp. CSR-4]|uniref:glycosyltransferase n=1 Tax=Microbispora sp. CSR-4 TaxID=2592813 RepID=UPI00164F26B0|nr:glycosyl transferase family 2 [Microbispora sp. CSR-4]
MTRTATTRSAWGTWIGFESCPTLLGRLVEGFAGPWIPLEDVPVPVASVASAVPASDADTARDGTLDAAPDGALDAAPDTTRDAARDAARNVTRDAAPGGTGAIGCVLLAARSPADLRRAVPLRGLLPTATRVRIAVADVPSWAAQPLPVAAPGACWRHLTEMRVTRRGRGWHLDAAFSEPVPAGDVVAHVANGLFGGCAATTPVAGLEGGVTADWRPGDPNVTLSPPGGPVPDRRDAPGCDLPLRQANGSVVAGPAVTGAAATSPGVTSSAVMSSGVTSSAATSPGVTSSAPAATGLTGSVLAGSVLAGSVLAGSVPAGSGSTGSVADGLLPPLDEAVINPIGFRRNPAQGIAVLAVRREGFVVALGTDKLVRLPASGRVTDVDIARLRDVRGVEVPGPQAAEGRTGEIARVVAALSAAGIPVLAAPDPARDRALGTALATALVAVTGEALASDLRREELSIRLRRAALREHGAAARWRGLALAAGLPVPPDPKVSILLCTRRPEMVPFAVEQMERQRGVSAELIVGLHGFTAREAAIPRTRLPLTVIEAPATTPFGEVLNRMAAVASGSCLAKVDDDDWYGPDHLADLLLARRYSGADLVGSAAEFVYLEPLDVTIRRCIGTERFVPLVAGGTMLVTRAAFEAAGGFRPLARTVDGQLLQAVEAVGGRIYRTHGLGYVLRRRSAYGHTWRQPVQSFLASFQEQWRGLVFNELMEDGARWRAEVTR